jgi:uncharacterized protein (TIGR03437 family)
MFVPTLMRFALFALLITSSLFAQTAGTINTIAGTGGALFSGDGGAATLAALNVAVDVSADRAGNLYIADQFNHRIRRIAANGIITTVAGTGVPGYTGDGGPAVNAQINTPTGVFADTAGNIFIAEPGNQRIRRVDPTGTITTIAGNGSKGYSGDGGAAISASLYNAVRVAVDPAGNVVIADQSNHRIRQVTPAGIITTIAGNGAGTPAAGAFSGDGGQATAASLNNPTALAITPAGVIYIADQFNQRIRRITTDGVITTIAGNGTAGFSGDGGAAAAASLNYPGGMALDAAGNIYFNDDLNYRTRRITLSTGVISTVAGNGLQGFSGDGGPAASASLNGNFGAAVDALGNLYIADSTNNRIREVYGAGAPGPTPRITSGGVVPIFNSSTTIQPGSWVSIFGNNLATGTATWNNDFPLTLGDISVTIDGKLAYLWYVSPTQINLQAPDDGNTGKSVNVVVTTPTGIATSTVTLGQFGPSFSVLDGKHVAGIILRSDGSGAYGGGTYDILGPTGTSLGYKTVAARAGDTLELFGIGFGPTNPVVLAGKAFTGAAQTTSSVVVSINGNTLNPTFAGLTSAGLYQINLVQIPAGVGSGDVALLATVSGTQTQTGVLLSLQ